MTRGLLLAMGVTSEASEHRRHSWISSSTGCGSRRGRRCRAFRNSNPLRMVRPKQPRRQGWLTHNSQSPAYVHKDHTEVFCRNASDDCRQQEQGQSNDQEAKEDCLTWCL